MNNSLVEISQALSPDGRRRVRFALHEIYPNEEQCNLNGITYLEEYVRANASSIIGMPFCATFLDEIKDIPYDHGITGENGYMPLFEDSEQVGSADGWSIEDIEIDGELHRVIIADGYINQQRYPKFVEWLETQRNLKIKVVGSIEFVGTKDHQVILYKDGKTVDDKYRVPTSYIYSGYCILNVKPSDSSAIMVELNEMKEKKNMEDKKNMDEKMLQSFVKEIKDTIIETNSVGEELTQKTSEFNNQIMEKNKEIEELRDQLKLAVAECEKKDEAASETNKLAETLQKELNECKKVNAINELDSRLADFTDEEKEIAKVEIQAFKEDFTKTQIIDIIKTINAGIGEKTKKNKISEINSAKFGYDTSDIFGIIEDPTGASIIDIENIFE